MQSEIDAASVRCFHDRQVRERDWPVMSESCSPQLPGLPATWEWIAANHRYNGLAWREQDRTRRLDVPPAEIAAGRHLIERYDQKRSAAVEAIDKTLLASLRQVACVPGAPLASATPGTLIDRLSRLAIAIHYLRTEAHGGHADEEQGRARGGRLARLQARRQDSLACLDTLLAEARAGRTYFKLQRPPGLYGDADLPRCSHGRVRESAHAYEVAAGGAGASMLP